MEIKINDYEYMWYKIMYKEKCDLVLKEHEKNVIKLVLLIL